MPRLSPSPLLRPSLAAAGLLVTLVLLSCAAPPSAAWEQASATPDMRWTPLLYSAITEFQCGPNNVLTFDLFTTGHGRIWHNGCSRTYTYMTFNLSAMPQGAYLDSANFTVAFRDIGGGPYSDVTWSIRALGEANMTNAAARARMAELNNSVDWDTYTNNHNETRRFQASPELTAYIQRAIDAGNASFTIAFATMNDTASAVLQPLSNVTVEYEYDASPPSAPGAQLMPAFLNVTQADFSWDAAFDNGSGVDGYFAAWTTKGDWVNPGGSSGWLNATTLRWHATGLPTTGNISFGVKARDAVGAQSTWSNITITRVDILGPSAPTNVSVPRFLAAPPIPVRWTPSADALSGVAGYFVRIRLYSGSFVEQFWVNGSAANYAEYTPQGANLDVLLRIDVIAVDNVGNPSSASPYRPGQVDTIAPTVALPDPEPAYTAGSANEFGWAASTDYGGSGVDHYEVRVSSDPTFLVTLASANVTINASTNRSFNVSGLQDGVQYFFEVRAVDAVGHVSAPSVVNSTQDASPPEAPLFSPLPTWLLSGQLNVSWSAAADAGGGVASYRFTAGTSPTFESLRNSTHAPTERAVRLEGFAEGSPYRLCVRATDVFGYASQATCVEVTADYTGPTVGLDPTSSLEATPGGHLFLQGTASDAVSGVAFVEARVDGGSWVSVSGTGSWSLGLDLEGAPTVCAGFLEKNGTIEFRTGDTAGNTALEAMQAAYHWLACPYPLLILSPAEGATLSGRAEFLASAPTGEGNVALEVLEGNAWSTAFRAPALTGFGSASIALFYDLHNLEDGTYAFRLALGSGRTSPEVRVEVRQVHLAMDPSELLVTPLSPLAGVNVTIVVKVQNDGAGVSGNLSLDLTVQGPNGPPRVFGKESEALAEGESWLASFSVRVPDAGLYNFSITLETSGEEAAPPALTAQLTAAAPAAPPPPPPPPPAEFPIVPVAGAGAAAALGVAAFAVMRMRRRKDPGAPPS